jgi:hypothetical protein
MPQLLQNLTVWADRTAQIAVPILDQFGNPYNVGGGGTAAWIMAPSNTLPAVLTKTTAGGGITLVLASTTWTATVLINPADTDAIAPGAYYHELSVKDASGNVVNVTIGTLTLAPSVYQY